MTSDVSWQQDHPLLLARFAVFRLHRLSASRSPNSQPPSLTAFKIAASNQAIVANALHVMSVEHVHRHIPSLTFQNASVMLFMHSSPVSAVLCFLARLRSKTRDLHTLFSVHGLSESVRSFIHASTNQTFKCPCSTVGFLATPAVSVLSSRNIVNLYTSSAFWEKHLAF